MTIIQIWYRGLVIRVFTHHNGEWDQNIDIIKAYMAAWNGGTVILHKHEQHTFSPEVSRLYKKRTLHKLGLDQIIP